MRHRKSCRHFVLRLFCADGVASPYFVEYTIRRRRTPHEV